MIPPPAVPVAAFALALVTALVLTPLTIRAAWATRYVDHPRAHKLHGAPTPLLGGVAVFVAALIAWLVCLFAGGTHGSRDVAGLLAGACVVLGLGLWDDRHGMQPPVKLAGQATAAAILLATAGVPDLGLGVVVNVAITLTALVALMNAINFLDNMNGMVAGLAPIALAAFAWTSVARGAWGVAAAELAVAGACVGFLRFNFPKARLFLGDAGSLFLGYSLGASAVLTFNAAPPGWGRLGPVIVLAYPVFDMIFVVITRLRGGRKVYLGGRDHTNHRLASVLRCPTRTVQILWLNGVALSASGLVVLSLNRPMPALLLLGLWTTALFTAGIRLSSVPIAPPPASP
ncbi:MAG: undecaprenyl/decaprenyl-phosphate alpha-N-acetylglucosaminyl 1-phosphate transferase [Candidatus Eisenbacteria bacterium]|nr:undecaprenyl/decaprenyl-phosphate alpha-N-acetylglucosaminyl 1-phosphate transferase [Candidatus Eisenbacteria bacterium]